MEEAHTFGTLPAYVGSLIDQPEAAQPFIALPARVEQAVWSAMRGQRPGFVKQVTREAVGDTVFLLRLAIRLNIHIEGVLRVERLRQVLCTGGRERSRPKRSMTRAHARNGNWRVAGRRQGRP